MRLQHLSELSGYQVFNLSWNRYVNLLNIQEIESTTTPRKTKMKQRKQTSPLMLLQKTHLTFHFSAFMVLCGKDRKHDQWVCVTERQDRSTVRLDLDESVCDDSKKKEIQLLGLICNRNPGSKQQFILSTAPVSFPCCKMWDMTAQITIT